MGNVQGIGIGSHLIVHKVFESRIILRAVRLRLGRPGAYSTRIAVSDCKPRSGSERSAARMEDGRWKMEDARCKKGGS